MMPLLLINGKLRMGKTIDNVNVDKAIAINGHAFCNYFYIGITIINFYLTNAILVLCIIASIIGVIDSLYTTIELNEQSIVKKSLRKVTEIPINKIESIYKMPTSKGNKIYLGVFSKGQKIYITFKKII